MWSSDLYVCGCKTLWEMLSNGTEGFKKTFVFFLKMASNRIGVFLSQFIVRLFASNSFFFSPRKRACTLLALARHPFSATEPFEMPLLIVWACFWIQQSVCAKQTLPCWRFGIVCAMVQFSFLLLKGFEIEKSEEKNLRNASVFSFSGDWSCDASRRVFFYALHKILRNDIHTGDCLTCGTLW